MVYEYISILFVLPAATLIIAGMARVLMELFFD